jgi:hypothetical protein
MWATRLLPFGKSLILCAKNDEMLDEEENIGYN